MKIQTEKTICLNYSYSVNKRMSRIKNLNGKMFTPLRRPIISLKEYDSLLDSDYNLNLSKKPAVCSNVHKLEKQISELFKMIRVCFNKFEEEKLKINDLKDIQQEWKEAARRIEYIFCVISITTILVTPYMLFGKFFIRDITSKNGSNFKCGCEF